MSFGEFLRQQMTVLEIKQTDIVLALHRQGMDVSRGAVSKWVNGDRIPRGGALRALLDVLGVVSPKQRLRAYELAASSSTDSGAVLTASEAT